MKAMSIENIIHNIGRLNPTIELKPGQIFSGKVLTLYPNDMAAVQLAGKKINAQLLTSLTLNQRYWFQVKPTKGGSLPTLEVLKTDAPQRPPVNALGVKKLDANMQRLIATLADEQLPMTKDLMGKAQKWLADVPSVDKGVLAIKTTLHKNLPMNESVFKALYHVQDERPMVTELAGLRQSLKSSQFGNSAVGDVLNRVLNASSQNNALDTVKQLFQMYTATNTDVNTKNKIENIFREMGLSLPTNQSANVNAEVSRMAQTNEMLLKQLKLDMTVPKGEVILQQKLSQLNNDQMSMIQNLIKQTGTPKPNLNLFEMVRSLGLTLEQDIVHTQLGELKNSHQLKSALMELLSQDIPASLKDRVESMLFRVTGQQLLHTNESQSLTSLFYQFPIHFKEWKSDLMMRWDMKRDERGEVDEDFSRILFYLNLQNLNETVIDMNVQNRIISVKIINENPDLNQLVSGFKEQLKLKLENLDYTLSTVKVEEPTQLPKHKFQSHAMDVSFQGVDMTI